MPIMPAQAADVTDTAAGTNTPLPALTFPVALGRMYYFRAVIPWTIADATDGAQFAVNVPATPTFLAWTAKHATSTTTDTIANSVTDAGEVSATTAAATTGNVTVIEGFCRPSVAGEVGIEVDSEGAGDVIVKAGAFIEYRDVTV